MKNLIILATLATAPALAVTKRPPKVLEIDSVENGYIVRNPKTGKRWIANDSAQLQQILTEAAGIRKTAEALPAVGKVTIK